ncbi:hypothetical protein ACLB2K_076792 [Fragaria x ananassa]
MEQANDIEQGDGGHKSTITTKELEETLKKHNEPRNRWNAIFTISCAIAIFIDPLYCYAPVIHGKCLELHQRLMWTYIGLRLAVDVFYAIDLGKWWSRSKKTKVLYLILVSLPLPELFGALWYRLAVQRQIDCWKSHCEKLLLETEHCKSISSRRFFCKKMSSMKTSDLSKWDELCHPVKEANPEVFDFGIYLHALQSNVTSSTHAVKRISQSFWWALRNLSSFGSNLQTSLYTMEIFLSVLISISGMALFLVYLNARVQESQKILMESKSKKKTQLLKPDIDLWLYKNNIRFQKDNIQEDEDLKRLKKAIMENIHKLGENNDIDLQNMLSILPVNDKKRIIRLLCLDSLKKVPILENIHENVLIAICQHLKPVTYTEDNYIVQEGRPLGKMIFIMQGLAWTYTASNIIGETLKRGDFYGEEVLTWAFQSLSFSGLPISTRSVMSQGKIEAFAIKADHLKSVVYKFWWHFRKEVGVSQLELWEHLAASSIQAAWRLRNAKSKPLSKWYKIPYP